MMIADSGKSIDVRLIAIDDDHDEVNNPTTVTSSIRRDNRVGYDNSKLASSCLTQFFSSYSSENKSAVCLLCNTVVKKSGDSTFNFVRHVKRHRVQDYIEWSNRLATKEEKNVSQQPDIKTAMTSPRGTKYSSNHPRQMELSRMVTHDLIIGLALPLSLVERPEFLRAMQTVDSKFVAPSRRSLSRDILPKSIEKVENELKRICRENRSVSLTLDLWTDRRMRSFYAITIHLVDKKVFKSYLLAFKHLSGIYIQLCL